MAIAGASGAPSSWTHWLGMHWGRGLDAKALARKAKHMARDDAGVGRTREGPDAEAAIQVLREAIKSPYYDRLEEIAKGNLPHAQRAAVDRVVKFDLAQRGVSGRVIGPRVSIVMPVWNAQSTVGDAIESILVQTYRNLELLICDDASDDKSVSMIHRFDDRRLTLLRQDRQQGAPEARNRCIQIASGKYIAYLDADNLWHPRYLESMLDLLERNTGASSAFASYFDVAVEPGSVTLRRVVDEEFRLERQLEKPFVDLNSFVHRASLTSALGGFDERLKRRQDYDLISRYAWLRDPVKLDVPLNIYQRFPVGNQITTRQREDKTCLTLIEEKVSQRYRSGLRARMPEWVKKVTVVSWDMSRNHFAKAFSVAEALSRETDVELISFRFFENAIFEPLAKQNPSFETKYFNGSDFPEFFADFSRALNAVTGDIIYAVKPRLPSFGLALLANFHRGTPIMLEVNDLETVVASPKEADIHCVRDLRELAAAPIKARSPHDRFWSELLDPLVSEIPTLFTHNRNLDRHYDNRCLYMRNVKDQMVFDPSEMDRHAIRSRLGFSPKDKIILFGGLVRKHKGIYETLDFVRSLGDPSYRLLFVGSRETPDLTRFRKAAASSAVFLPPQTPAAMAEINFASDLVLLWLDPHVPATHYQMPYKLTDALAMGATVVASPVSDLPLLEDAGAIWTVPFGDFERLAETVQRILSDDDERARRSSRARRIFEREFSYNAVVSNVAIAAHRIEKPAATYDVAIRFARAFSEFRSATRAGGHQ